MEQITEKLERLTELTDAELAELETAVLAEFETVEKQDLTQQTVEAMNRLADALDQVRAESTTRAETAAQLSAQHKQLTERVHAAAEKTDADDESADESVEADVEPSTDDTEVPAAVGKPSEPVQIPLPVAASTEQPAEANLSAEDSNEAALTPGDPAPEQTATDQKPELTAEADNPTNTATQPDNGKDPEGTVTASASVEQEPIIQPPADRRPTMKIQEAPVAITAGADIPGVTAGATLPSMDAVAEAMVQRLHSVRRSTGGDGEQHVVATLQAAYPSDRTLHSGALEENTRKVQDVISPQAITAAGGLCAPVNVRYDIFGLGTTGRPVKDSLATFAADRGGIRFITPPRLTDLNGAVSLWTVQDDIDAATAGAPDPVKPCIRVNCGTEVSVLTDAIPLCLTFGNLVSRTYPEMVKRHNELGLIQHARFAEQRLLTRIGALSTQVTAASVLGAARDYFVSVERAAAAYRNRHRMDVNAPLRVVAPAWLNNMMRADLVMQLPGDGDEETFALAQSRIDAWFRLRNINVTWTIDGETGQMFGTQGAGALIDFPGTVVWYLFAEGTFLFLDGGTLDLGLVRDSTLNGTNDYKMFLETFEGVAMVGLEALRITSTLEINGSVAGTVATNI